MTMMWSMIGSSRVTRALLPMLGAMGGLVIGAGDARAQFTRQPPAAAWKDQSPHRVGFVGPVGRRVQFLDWGGRGPALVLLHGWNSNAHIFDDIAPKLTGRFHVVALTLPGFGESDVPRFGYALDAASDVVTSAMDSLKIPHASLAGHSFAGWILSRMATRHATRIDRMIYLDAAFNLRASDSIVARRPVPRPALVAPKTREDLVRWLRGSFFGTWTPALEAEYRGRSPDEARRDVMLKPIVNEAERGPEEWARIKAPVLAICAMAEVSSEFPWLTPRDSNYATARKYVDAERRPFQHRECARFGRTVPGARTLELNGHHYIFVVKQPQVVAAITSFLSGK
ncbi:MAG: alpha/beta hydrolase [bacterium]